MSVRTSLLTRAFPDTRTRFIKWQGRRSFVVVCPLPLKADLSASDPGIRARVGAIGAGGVVTVVAAEKAGQAGQSEQADPSEVVAAAAVVVVVVAGIGRTARV